MNTQETPEDIARTIIGLYEQGSQKEIQEYFDSVEKDLDRENISHFRDIVELIQNIASQRSYGYSVFEPFLKGNVKLIWDEVVKEWEGISTLADMVRKEKGLPPQNKFIDADTVTSPALKAYLEANQRRQKASKSKKPLLSWLFRFFR